MFIHIKVKAGAKKEVFSEKSSDHFIVSVREKAERNMANDRARELVAEYFRLPVAKVKIINGHHSPSKIFSVEKE